MRENAEMALSSAIGEQVAKIAGAVWIHNLHSTGEEKMAIQTPEGRTITTSLKPSDVCDSDLRIHVPSNEDCPRR